MDGSAWYDCRECEAIYPSLSGLTMHRNRAHVSETLKASRRKVMSDAQKAAAARKREEQRLASTLVAEDPDVQAILLASRKHGTKEYDARRKRWQNAKKRGTTEAEFAVSELQRAIAIAADPSITVESEPEPEPKAKIAKPKKVTEVAQADDLFDRVGQATDILFPNGVPGGQVLIVAELQKNMLALMQGAS
jgi:hypothetical protein